MSRTSTDLPASIDSLGSLAADVAMRAAAAYIRQNRLKVLDWDAATECLKRYMRAKLPQAMDDAKQAMDCGMTAIAEVTFRASMAQAGIEAAKEFAVVG